MSYAVVFGEVVWSLHEERSCVNFLLSCIYILHHLLECLESSRAHRRQQQQETNEILKTSCSSRRQEEEEAASGKDNLICKLNRRTDSGSFCSSFLLKIILNGKREFSESCHTLTYHYYFEVLLHTTLTNHYYCYLDMPLLP